MRKKENKSLRIQKVCRAELQIPPSVGYPKGIPVDFYMNLFWQGLEFTLAFNQMAAITVSPPLLSPYQKYDRDRKTAASLTRPCGS
jgi:hypothetical protein